MRKAKADRVLVNWMKEFFPYAEFRKAGIFTKEMRGDYKAQSDHICQILGLQSIFEYRKEEIRCHVSYVNPACPAGICTNGRPMRIDEFGKLREEPFITVIPSIWEDKELPIQADCIDGSKYDEGDEEPGDGDSDCPALTKPPKFKL